MRLLLDSSVFYWQISGDLKLPSEIIKIIEENESYVSIATIWELLIKKAKNKISFDIAVFKELEQHGYQVLPIKTEHALEYYTLPNIHKDPFDRMIIAQALHENLELVTSDQEVLKYDIKCHEVKV